MAEFYDHPATGLLHFRSVAGGGTSIFDAVATEADIAANQPAYRDYLAMKALPPAPQVTPEVEAPVVDVAAAETMPPEAGPADQPAGDVAAAPSAAPGPQPLIKS